ncbi:THUMP [Macleaya cordata]|uniref:THUMP n=1 Tax=Macleaya cordata TaxID=56857 RepID=A0A200QUX6_MACCD|nr:THUMP [Macleaya cordata]
MAEEEEQELGLGFGKEETEEKAVTMTPWEQHSAVISIPRFDYNAPSSLLQYSHSGFLITCTIKREKSATKEAISVLAKYVGSLSRCSSESSEAPDGNMDVKKRKICSEETGRVNGAESQGTIDGSAEISRETTSSSAKMDAIGERGILSLVKLTRSGLLLITFPRNNSPDTVDIVSNIIHSLDSGNLKPLAWCHRIFPIQATCVLKEEDLRTIVSNQVQKFLDCKQDKFETPLKFAVGYNRRGIDETEMKIHKSNPKYSNLLELLDRNKCFSIVAGAVKDIIPDSVVDLKSPELAIFVELLPLSGMPNGSLVVAVSVLPHNIITAKPRLCVKALVSDSKTTKRQN